MYIIVLTGPESTGKSTLAKELSKHYNGVYIPEYAREYVENLGRDYYYDDVVKIAKMQYKQYKDVCKLYKKTDKIIFMDTFLIITKVWFEYVYKQYPDWIQNKIETCNIDLYALCKPDISWEYDPVRENGNDEIRNELYEVYKKELELANLPYTEVSGKGAQRIETIINYIDDNLLK